MPFRIKEQQDNVVYVDFDPNLLNEEGQGDEPKMFQEFVQQSRTNHNIVVLISMIGIVMSFIVFSVLLLASVLIAS